MKLGTLTKQPREEISCSVNFDEALDPRDSVERIRSVEVTPPGVLRIYALVAGRDRIRLFVSGGEDKERYAITTRVLTSRGEMLEDELTLKVKEIGVHAPRVVKVGIAGVDPDDPQARGMPITAPDYGAAMLDLSALSKRVTDVERVIAGIKDKVVPNYALLFNALLV